MGGLAVSVRPGLDNSPIPEADPGWEMAFALLFVCRHPISFSLSLELLSLIMQQHASLIAAPRGGSTMAKLPWQEASLWRALGAGLLAALLNSVFIQLVKMIGIMPGKGGLSHLMLWLANNVLTVFGAGLHLPDHFGPLGQEVFHTVMGLLMALVYAFFFYHYLRGPDWLRGLLFSQFPWLLQVFVVLPWAGAGLLGLRLSPLTPVVSFSLNALYGATLGVLYWPAPRQRIENIQRKESFH